MHKEMRNGTLTMQYVDKLMATEKPNQRETLKIPMDKVRKYAPRVTDNQLEDFVLKACDYYQRYLKRLRDRER